MSRLLRDYPLSIVLTLFFLVTIGLAGVTGWMEFSADQREHGQEPQLTGDDGFTAFYSEQVLQNWQSEFLALGLMIALNARLIHRGSAKSKDGHDELKRRISKTEQRVDELARRRTREAA